MRKFTDAEQAVWPTMIGKKVWKNPKTTSKFQPKPFKSGNKVNTVKGIVVHEQTGRPGFTFVEDESVVECFRCSIAPELEMPIFAVEKIDDDFVPSYMYEGIILRG